MYTVYRDCDDRDVMKPRTKHRDSRTSDKRDWLREAREALTRDSLTD